MEDKAFFRQWCILQSIFAHANRGISLSDLAQERGVSKKTIQRDVSYLSSLSFPIYSENIRENNQVIYKMLPHYQFPSISFNQHEFFTLLFLFKSAYPLQAYFDGVIRDCFNKMHSQSSPELVQFYRKIWNYILPDTKAAIPWSDESSRSLSKILSAIIDGKKLRFKYMSVMSRIEKEHTVTVLCLKLHENNFYIAAHSKEKDKVLVYAINRMLDADTLADHKDKIDFNAEEFFENSFGIYVGDSFQVKLLFNKNIAPYIQERVWHTKQKMQILSDGSVDLEFPACSINEIKKFVLSYGSNVKVLEPTELIESIKESLNEMSQIYQD